MGRHHKSVVISPYSPKSHGSNTHTRVSMSSIKDDQNVAFLFFQLGPATQPRQPRYADVNDQARGAAIQFGFEEISY